MSPDSSNVTEIEKLLSQICALHAGKRENPEFKGYRVIRVNNGMEAVSNKKRTFHLVFAPRGSESSFSIAQKAMEAFMENGIFTDDTLVQDALNPATRNPGSSIEAKAMPTKWTRYMSYLIMTMSEHGEDRGASFFISVPDSDEGVKSVQSALLYAAKKVATSLLNNAFQELEDIITQHVEPGAQKPFLLNIFQSVHGKNIRLLLGNLNAA